MKFSKRQQSLAYYAQAVLEWRAKGYTRQNINRMLICALEGTRSAHPHPASDAGVVLEIADGLRCA